MKSDDERLRARNRRSSGPAQVSLDHLETGDVKKIAVQPAPMKREDVDATTSRTEWLLNRLHQQVARAPAAALLTYGYWHLFLRDSMPREPKLMLLNSVWGNPANEAAASGEQMARQRIGLAVGLDLVGLRVRSEPERRDELLRLWISLLNACEGLGARVAVDGGEWPEPESQWLDGLSSLASIQEFCLDRLLPSYLRFDDAIIAWHEQQIQTHLWADN